jgi:exonuclease VII small subunit
VQIDCREGDVMSMFTRIDIEEIVSNMQEAVQEVLPDIDADVLDRALESFKYGISDGLGALIEEAEEKESFEDSVGELETKVEDLEQIAEEVETGAEWDKMQAGFDYYANGKGAGSHG